MKTVKKSLAFSVIVLILVGTVTHSSAHRWSSNYGQYRYYPHQSFQKYNQPNVGVSQENVEWVCTNPKTKDTMIIASDTVPRVAVAESPGVWRAPNYPQGQPPVTGPPIHIQLGSVDLQPPSNGQFYPPANNPNQVQPDNTPWVELSTKRPERATVPPKTDGEGLIDIRMGP